MEAFVNKQKLVDPITEKKFFADLKNVVKITTSTRTPDPEQQTHMNDVVDNGGVALDALRALKDGFDQHTGIAKDEREAYLRRSTRTTTRTPDPEQQKRMNDVVTKLVDDHGYCEHCANELIKYVGTLLSR